MEDQEVLVTSGFRQGAGLVVDTLVPVGGAVGVEAPTYNGFLGILRARGAKTVPIECDAEGMIPAALEKAMAECKVEVKSDGTAATAAQYADAVMALL